MKFYCLLEHFGGVALPHLFKDHKGVIAACSILKMLMEQVEGIEPSFQPWQGRVITIIPHLHIVPVRGILVYFTTAEARGERRFSSSDNSEKLTRYFGADGRTRTDNLQITRLLRYHLRHISI